MAYDSDFGVLVGGGGVAQTLDRGGDRTILRFIQVLASPCQKFLGERI